RLVDRLHAMPQQILKTEHERKLESLFLRVGDGFHDVDRGTMLLGQNLDVAALIDREITAAPTINVVERNRGFDIPALRHASRILELSFAFSIPTTNFL